MTDGQNLEQTEEQTDGKRKTDRNEMGEREKTDNRQTDKILNRRAGKGQKERQRDRKMTDRWTKFQKDGRKDKGTEMMEGGREDKGRQIFRGAEENLRGSKKKRCHR